MNGLQNVPPWTQLTNYWYAGYKLTTQSTTGGTVAPWPGSTYIPEQQVQLSATPGGGYVFTGFSGSVSTMTNPVTVVMNSDKVVTANFAPAPTVTCSATPSTAYVGQTVTFTPSPSGGTPPYTYTWSGAVSGSGSQILFQPSLTQPYNESVTVRDSLGAQSSGACSVNVRQLQTLAELQTCIINAPAQGECALAAGSYSVGTPIKIERSDIVVRAAPAV